VTAGGKCEVVKSVEFLFVISDTEKSLVIHADNLIQCAYFIVFLSTAAVIGYYGGCKLSV
jgi:hypothetical protein